MKRFLVLAILVAGCAHNSGNSGDDGGSDVPPGCGDGMIVRVNRGLFTAATNAQGSYTVTGVAAGTWEISVVYVDHNATAQQLSVTSGQMSSANFTLAHN